MKERPILFSGPMVRAILEGRKTQTRRVIKTQPPEEMTDVRFLQSSPDDAIFEAYTARGLLYLKPGAKIDGPSFKLKCPYGKPGDRLWVRETFAIGKNGGRLFKADEQWTKGFVWTPSIHMPRSASRITLEITSIRVERVQEIRLGDLWAESFRGQGGFDEFRSYFDWAANPWVWVIEFKRCM